MRSKDFNVQDGDKELKLMVRQPIPEDLDEAAKVRAGVIADCIRNKKKLLLRQEIDEYLREHNVWTDDDINQVRQIQEEINGLLNKLRRGGIKLSEGRDIAIEITNKRTKLMNIMFKRQVFDDATVESLADNAEKEYLIYASTINSETGERFWSSLDDMLESRSSELYVSVLNNFNELAYGIDAYEQNLPEIKWLKKNKFIDGELRYINRKTGERITKDGKPVKQVEQENLEAFDNLQGDIQEESPFIDDYEEIETETATETVVTETTESKEEVPALSGG